MPIGNEWLGALVVSPLVDSQNLASNSMLINTPIYSDASVIDYVCVHLSDAIEEQFYLSLMPFAGTHYTSLIYATTTTGKTSVLYRFEGRPMFLNAGDRLQLRITNDDTAGNVYSYVLQML
jgi:hypothetical protein